MRYQAPVINSIGPAKYAVATAAPGKPGDVCNDGNDLNNPNNRTGGAYEIDE